MYTESHLIEASRASCSTPRGNPGFVGESSSGTISPSLVEERNRWSTRTSALVLCDTTIKSRLVLPSSRAGQSDGLYALIIGRKGRKREPAARFDLVWSTMCENRTERGLSAAIERVWERVCVICTDVVIKSATSVLPSEERARDGAF